MEVTEHTAEIAGMPAFWRTAGDDPVPVLYLHGVPTSSDDWLPFLAVHGGIAPDLPGFGRTGKPGHFDYSLAGYADWLESFLEHISVDRIRLVVHDWGAVGLAFAQRHPERVARLIVCNAVPLLPGYEWHRIARIWRTPVLGELAMGATTRWVLRQLSREANATPGPLPPETIDSIWAHFDQGTQRAILRLYRSAPPDVLRAAGEGLGALRCPSLIAWGVDDPYIAPDFADAYAARLPDAKIAHLPGAGHWPWLDRPGVIDDFGAFLGQS